MEKLKQILAALEKLEPLAQAEVDDGEFYMFPVLRDIQKAVQSTRARITQLDQWSAEQKGQKSSAKAETESKAEAKAETKAAAK